MFSFFQFVFDNYSVVDGPLSACPAPSRSQQTPGDILPDDSSGADSAQQEMAELRQQLQAMKKQAITIMDQSRKSSDREKIALRQAQEAMKLKEIAVAEALQAIARENCMLELMTDASGDMAGTLHLFYFFLDMTCISCHMLPLYFLFLGSFVDASAEDQRVNSRVEILFQLARENLNGVNFWASEDRSRQIVRFQDRAAQVREFLEFCTKTLALVYNAMFPRNLQPKTLLELMDKFRSIHQIHGFVKAQLTVGARFSLVMLQICYPKLDMSNIVDRCHASIRKIKRNVDKINDAVAPVAEEMIEDLLRMDGYFFKEYHYADTMGASAEDERINIDNLI
jgi:hypothetical protein